MDARSYLSSRGWKGEGHGLGSTQSGIKKPLLVSKKVDVLGVGLNKHKAVSDQWWLRAFDQGLKDFGTGKKGALGQVREHGHHRGGLYGRFVSGGVLEGTLGDEESEEASGSGGGSGSDHADGGKKRKRDGEEDGREMPNKSKRKGGEVDPGSASATSSESEVNTRELRAKQQACLKEAFRRGVIQARPSQIAKGLCPQEGVILPPLALDDPIRTALDHVAKTHGSKSGTTDMAMVDYRKGKRELKRFTMQLFAPGFVPVKKVRPRETERKRAKRERQRAKVVEEGREAEERLRKKAKKAGKHARKEEAGLQNAVDSLAVQHAPRQTQQCQAQQNGVAETTPKAVSSNSFAISGEKPAEGNGVINNFSHKTSARKMERFAKNAERERMPLQEYLQRKEDRRLKNLHMNEAKKVKARGTQSMGNSSNGVNGDSLGFVVDTTGEDHEKLNKKLKEQNQKAAKKAA